MTDHMRVLRDDEQQEEQAYAALQQMSHADSISPSDTPASCPSPSISRGQDLRLSRRTNTCALRRATTASCRTRRPTRTGTTHTTWHPTHWRLDLGNIITNVGIPRYLDTSPSRHLVVERTRPTLGDLQPPLIKATPSPPRHELN